MSQVSPAVSGTTSGAYAPPSTINVAASGGNGNSGTPGNPTHPIAPIGGVTVASSVKHDTSVVPQPVDDTAAAAHVAAKQAESVNKVNFEKNRIAESMEAKPFENKFKDIPASQVMYKDPAALVDEKL